MEIDYNGQRIDFTGKDDLKIKSGPAALFTFEEAEAVHSMVDAGTTKTTWDGTVDAWIKVRIGGAIAYIPCFDSKTT